MRAFSRDKALKKITTIVSKSRFVSGCFYMLACPAYNWCSTQDPTQVLKATPSIR